MQSPSSPLCSHSLQEKNPAQEPIPIVLRETVAYLQAHGECCGALGLVTFQPLSSLDALEKL